MKPLEELELSLPLLCLPLVNGVDVPGGDSDRFGLFDGEDVPGDRERGGTYRWAVLVDVKGKGDVERGFGEARAWLCDSDAVLVVIVRAVVDVAFVVVVDTCAGDTSDEGETTAPVALVFA